LLHTFLSTVKGKGKGPGRPPHLL